MRIKRIYAKRLGQCMADRKYSKCLSLYHMKQPFNLWVSVKLAIPEINFHSLSAKGKL